MSDGNAVALNRFILQQPPDVSNNLEPVYTPGLGYHISPDSKIVNFVPRQMTRILPGENLSVRRVCLGHYLLDALRGYGVLVNDFLTNGPQFDDPNKWKGGYYIYEVPYKASIIPGVSLNPMAAHTDERWLVDYLKEGQEYPAKIIGRFFSAAATLGDRVIERKKRTEAEANKLYHPLTELIIYLEVFPNESITFNLEKILKPGYYRIKISDIGYLDGRYDLNNVSYERLSDAEYIRAKRSGAELLSYKPPKRYQW